jgi:hypothetical protein
MAPHLGKALPHGKVTRVRHVRWIRTLPQILFLCLLACTAVSTPAGKCDATVLCEKGGECSNPRCTLCLS